MRVAVTGLGCITPVGNSVQAFRAAMYAGRSGIAPFPSEFPGALSSDPGLRFKTTATVKDFDPGQHLNPSVLTVADRSAQFGIVAAQQALEDSGVLNRYDPATMAVITGCACGGRSADEDANR